MASTEKRMPAELYLSWEDLLAEDEEEHAPSFRSTPEGDAFPASAQAAELELPSDLKALLAEKERLERELKKLTGEAAVDPEDARRQQMFPVKVHTKESRIEERRLRQRDEQLRMQAQRVLEQRRISAQLERRREQLNAQLQHAAIEEQRLRERWARERHEALLEASRKQASEFEWQARRERLREFRASIRPRAADDRTREDGRYVSSGARQAAAQSEIERQHEVQRANALARRAAERMREEVRQRQWRQALERQRENRIHDTRREQNVFERKAVRMLAENDAGRRGSSPATKRKLADDFDGRRTRRTDD